MLKLKNIYFDIFNIFLSEVGREEEAAGLTNRRAGAVSAHSPTSPSAELGSRARPGGADHAPGQEESQGSEGDYQQAELCQAL